MTVRTASIFLLGLAWLRHGSRAPAAGVPTDDGVRDDRVAVYSADDPVYRQMVIPASIRVAPAAPERLLVFRSGVCVLDRGLRDTREESISREHEALARQDGLIEEARVSRDGGVAALVTTRYAFSVEAADPSGEGEATRGTAEVTWIDPWHVDGAWTIRLEPGHRVKEALPMSSSRGIAVSTWSARANGGADFVFFSASGHESIRIPLETGSVVDIVDTAGGRFLAVGLAFPEQIGGPNCGVRVIDLAEGGQWTYTWRYGADNEPLSWKLLETGELLVRTPSGSRRFDSAGPTSARTASGS